MSKETIEELTVYDFKDTIMVPNGYDLTQVVTVSDDNFQLLVEEHNKLVNSLKEFREFITYQDNRIIDLERRLLDE